MSDIRQLGDLLVARGAVSAHMLDYAINISQTAKTRLDETLVALGFATEQEMAQAMAQLFGVGFSDLKEGLSEDVLRLVPFSFAKKYEVLPLAMSEGYLVVAVSDPSIPNLNDLLSRFTPHPVRLSVACKSLLVKEIHRRYYRIDHPLEGEIKAIAERIAQDRDFPAQQLSELLLASAIDSGASDIHISPTPMVTLVSMRIDGVLQLRYSLPAMAHQRLVSTVKVSSAMDIADQNRAQDGRMSFEYLETTYDLRVSTVPGVFGENLVIRVLAGNDGLHSLSAIGFSEGQIQQLDRLTRHSNGSILVTGPTGSGKTTTLYAMLRRVDMLRRNVLTVEDPVEIRVPMARQVEVNEKAGLTFSSAIRAFLRQDPDVILVGEIRDTDTAQLTLRAAQTGHLVFSTAHTNSAIGVIVRLRDLGCADYVLSASLTGVIAQRLVRRLCSHCRESAPTPAELLAIQPHLPNVIYQHQGCVYCNNTGYQGRLAIAEIIEFDSELRALIERGGMPTELEQMARDKGIRSLAEVCMDLVAQGVTDYAEFNRVM